MFLSYHHVVHGKYAKGRGGKPRHRTCQLLCRAITGETHTVEIDRKSTVGDLQKPVCDLFGKEYPATTVSFVVNEVVHDDFCAQPFRASTVSSEARVLFYGKVQIVLRQLNGEMREIAVDPSASLRELQALVCKIFRKRFPAMKATLVVGDDVYDEFIQVPFRGCSGSVEAIITFADTDDPYFYDLRDRCPGNRPSRDSSPEPLRLG